MARLVWMVLCSKTTIDQRSNNISLLEVIEQLNVEKGPPDQDITVPVSWELAILSTRTDPRSPEQQVGRVTIQMPSGRSVEVAQIEIKMTGDHRRIRNTIQSNALPLHGPGIYEFVLEYKEPTGPEWREVGRFPLEITFSS